MFLHQKCQEMGTKISTRLVADGLKLHRSLEDLETYQTVSIRSLHRGPYEYLHICHSEQVKYGGNLPQSTQALCKHVNFSLSYPNGGMCSQRPENSLNSLRGLRTNRARTHFLGFARAHPLKWVLITNADRSPVRTLFYIIYFYPLCKDRPFPS